MTAIKSFRDLQVWQEGRQLASLAYRMPHPTPKEEQCGLIGQMRRAAVFVPSNNAEGYGRRSRADYVRFLNVAMGSLDEPLTQAEIASPLEYVAESDYRRLIDDSREIERTRSSLIRKLALLLSTFVPLCLCPFS